MPATLKYDVNEQDQNNYYTLLEESQGFLVGNSK